MLFGILSSISAWQDNADSRLLVLWYSRLVVAAAAQFDGVFDILLVFDLIADLLYLFHDLLVIRLQT